MSLYPSIYTHIVSFEIMLYKVRLWSREVNGIKVSQEDRRVQLGFYSGGVSEITEIKGGQVR
jgi:hypothetical protein